MRPAVDRWEPDWHDRPDVLPLAGPDHFVLDLAEGEHRAAPVGFRPPVRTVEPMLWEGDNA